MLRYCLGAGKRPAKLGRSAHVVAGGAATFTPCPLARLCRRGTRVVGRARFRVVRPFLEGESVTGSPPVAGADRPHRPRQNRVPAAGTRGTRHTGESDPHSTCVNTATPP